MNFINFESDKNIAQYYFRFLNDIRNDGANSGGG